VNTLKLAESGFVKKELDTDRVRQLPIE
jgi:hypothetical protein